MAAITWTDVVAIAPELSTVGATAQTYLLAWGNEALHVATFGGTLGEDSPTLRLARIYLVAHAATMGNAGASGRAGAVESEKIEDIEQRYARAVAVENRDSTLGTTAYGAMFLLLRRTKVIPMMVL